MIDLDKLEALAKGATPGPWFYQDASDAYTHIVRPVDNPGRIIASGTQTSDARGETTGRFIAAANPSTVLELIALVRELAVVSIPVIKEGAKIEGGAPVVPDSELPELPDPLEINWPELHSHALGCGVEDRNIHDRYEAAEYGWQDGVDKTMESVPDAIYDADMMREYGAACFAAGRATAPVVDVCQKTPALELHDDQIYSFWLYRDCMDAIRAGDMKGQFVAAVRALLAKHVGSPQNKE